MTQVYIIIGVRTKTLDNTVAISGSRSGELKVDYPNTEEYNFCF